MPLSNYIIHRCNNSLLLAQQGVIDTFSATSLFLLIHSNYPTLFLCSYFFFFSALLVTIYTDIQEMLISRAVTLYSIPLACVLSFFGYLPLSLAASVSGAVSGFCALSAIALTFKLVTKKDGLGQGDIDLIAFIGSFTGFLGWWATLMIGSFAASLYGILYMVATRQIASVKLPFGPFLALGAILYVLIQEPIIRALFAL